MTNEELIKEIPSLPSEIKNRIGRMIEQFKKDQAAEEKLEKRRPLRDEPFFGMWKDREDMKDGGAAYIRRLRDEQWNRHRR
ncbi:MAG: hypothetical protein ABL999_14075 [Pyrinomonadaceae bacterium]